MAVLGALTAIAVGVVGAASALAGTWFAQRGARQTAEFTAQESARRERVTAIRARRERLTDTLIAEVERHCEPLRVVYAALRDGDEERIRSLVLETKESEFRTPPLTITQVPDIRVLQTLNSVTRARQRLFALARQSAAGSGPIERAELLIRFTALFAALMEMRAACEAYVFADSDQKSPAPPRRQQPEPKLASHPTDP